MLVIVVEHREYQTIDMLINKERNIHRISNDQWLDLVKHTETENVNGRGVAIGLTLDGRVTHTFVQSPSQPYSIVDFKAFSFLVGGLRGGAKDSH